MTMKKLRVGVLMGGRSIEHEVSFNSGRTVCDHLDTSQFTIIPMYQTRAGALYILPWHFLHRGKTTDFSARLDKEAEHICWDDLKERIDFMYLAIHGRFAEDGTIQGFLEVLNIPYLGSGVFASALSMDKVIQKNILSRAGITVPRGIVIYPHELKNLRDNPEVMVQRLECLNIKAPYIVKPSGEGSSIGVSVVTDPADLFDKIFQASAISGYHLQPVLIEEKLSGMEFSCIVITDYMSDTLVPMPPTEIAQSNPHAIFDYEQKYMPGRAFEYTPPRSSQDNIAKIQQTSVLVTQILGITNISRVDGFLTKDGHVVIFEANTLSGMGPASLLFREAAEISMSHTSLINHLIKTELHAYGILETQHQQSIKENQASMNSNKIRVAILLGGQTHEKEISLESGRNVVYKLSPAKYEAIPIFVSSNMELFKLNQSLLVRNSTQEIESLVEQSSKLRWADLPKIADFVFIGLHGGSGENGAVQGTLEMLGLPYNGSSVLASAMCMDKYKTNEFLHTNGIDVPKSVFIAKEDWYLDKESYIKRILQTCGLPMIIKPHDDGCTVMVQKIKKESDIEHAVELIFEDGKTHVLAEEFVGGMELTVGVIGNDHPKALPPSQAVVTGDVLSIEEKFLPGAGENQTPAPLSAEVTKLVQSVMEKAYSVIGCKGYVRIDCFYQNQQQSPTGKERVIILEINTLPGLTPATCLFHQAAEIGIKPMDFIDLIIELGLQLHTKRDVAKESFERISTDSEIILKISEILHEKHDA